MTRHTIRLLITAILLSGFASWAAADEDAILRGKKTYSMHCARCHGDQGLGDGMDAKRLPVAPRNLVKDEYKFKTTAYGTPPSDEDLIHVLDYGMSGSGMPSFKNLGADTKKDLVAYIKSISEQFGDYEPEPISAPNEKLKFNLVRGEQVFNELQCALCHGTDGRANGTSAKGLSVKPANLTQGWRYKAGHKPVDIYYRLTAGIAGSGMPSYADTGIYTNEDLWHLAGYVHSLQQPTNWALVIEALETDKPVPTGAESEMWKEADFVTVNLEGSFYQWGVKEQTQVKSADIQAIFNEKEIAFKVTWNDPEENSSGVVDSLLIGLKPEEISGDPRANLHTLYGNGSDELPLALWRADAPTEVAHRKSQVIQAVNNWVRPDETFPAQAEYNNGLWTLVFKTDVKDLKEKVNPHTGRLYLGLMAWDGGNNERAQKRSASQWIGLNFGKIEAYH